jgi:hypothetical protein
MTNQLRAKKGGEFGANGEWYEGGKFIATTERSKGIARRSKISKVEIEPFRWEVPPSEGATSIWSQIQHFVTLSGKQAVISLSDTTAEYYNVDRAVLSRLCELFNNGERWIDF